MYSFLESTLVHRRDPLMNTYRPDLLAVEAVTRQSFSTNIGGMVMPTGMGDSIVAQALEGITKARGRDQFVLYKNNSDGKGNSYGYHENYLVSRAVPFERITQVLTPFFVTRSIYAGSGKVGAENQTSPVDYQISQRADFFETLVDLNTMVRRPIINPPEAAILAVGAVREDVIVKDGALKACLLYTSEPTRPY